MGANQNKPKILLLMPGPVYDMDTAFNFRLSELSDNYRGSLLAWSHKSFEQQYGEFTCQAVKTPDADGQKKSFIGMYRVARRLMKQAQFKGDPYQLVISYEPIKLGLMTLLLRHRFGSKAVVEINGVYDSPYVYIDMPRSLKTRIKRTLFVAIEKFVLRRADGIKLLFSEQIAGFSPFPRDPVIASFSDLTRLQDFHNLEHRAEIFFAGFPYLLKGIDVLIEAFKQLSDRFPDWELKIVGWFEDKSQIMAAIGKHPKIKLYDAVPFREMPAHMGKTGIVVLPSRTEGMGRVLLEAMACEKPRIGSNVDGIPTVINDGVDGILVEPGSVESLAAAMASLMSNEALRKQLGEQGKIRAGTEFASENYFRQMDEFLTQVLARR